MRFDKYWYKLIFMDHRVKRTISIIKLRISWFIYTTKPSNFKNSQDYIRLIRWIKLYYNYNKNYDTYKAKNS